MKNTQTYKSIAQLLVLAIALLILSVYGFMEAQWTPPPSGPTVYNVDAPINVGPDTQTKSGNMGANIVSAIDQMWSDEYCDGSGNNCTKPLPQCAAGEVVVADGTGGWSCGAN